MTRKFKGAGLFACLVLAASATGASSAQASNFTASSYPTTFTGVSGAGNDDIVTQGGSAECEKTHFVGTLSSASASVTVTPTYFGCMAFGFPSATINMNGCDYIFHSNGEFDISCSGTNSIVITAGTCEVKIGSHTGFSVVELANGIGDITERLRVTGLVYTVTKDGFGCPFAGTGIKTGGEYVEDSAVTLQSTNGATIDIG